MGIWDRTRTSSFLFSGSEWLLCGLGIGADFCLGVRHGKLFPDF